MPSPIDFAALGASAFAFTIASAWNATALKVINTMCGGTNAVCATVLYAMIVTIIVIVLVVIINKATKHVYDMKNALMKRLRGSYGLSNEMQENMRADGKIENVQVPYIHF